MLLFCLFVALTFFVGLFAVSYLDAVEGSAVVKGKPYFSEPAGPASLCQLVSLVTVLEVAQIVMAAHSQGCEPAFVQELVINTGI